MFVTVSVKHQPAVGRASSKQRTVTVNEWQSLHKASAYALLKLLGEDLEFEIIEDTQQSEMSAAREAFASAAR
jgi:hypothetical protein